ncbi:C2H2 type zinc-finger-domain-containing protein [Gautieria morchelliformis]|nr:C2H2 type zinc-finger-domain-containing protein [Gautieria morchelliformis]
MSVTVEMTTNLAQQPLFTCMSCSIGFPTAEDQRVHYRSDHHRYNMKRRVASLPPITAAMFNQKVLQRRAETAVTTSPKGATCEVCNKVYTTENAYRSHMNSKKHKENELKTSPQQKVLTSSASVTKSELPNEAVTSNPRSPSPSQGSHPGPSGLRVDDDADDDAITQTIDAKIAAARSRLSPTSCLFCPHHSSTMEDLLAHMSVTHSFFIPDMEYLQDLNGLLTYLGEKVAVGNVCLFCNGKGREFRTIEAVWKHMSDKGHCKIAYDEEKDRLEMSDFYDFSSSYPDATSKGKKAAKSKRMHSSDVEEEEQEWEDVNDDGEADEIIDEGSSEDEDGLPEPQIAFGDTDYELVLASGARIGHRSMRRYYAQSFPTSRASEDPKSGAAIVRRLLADKRSDLVPVKGGYGAFGTGTQVIKARNRGEAKEAGRHIREFRDQRRKEDYKTRVAFVHNHQKHFRDPLLQITEEDDKIFDRKHLKKSHLDKVEDTQNRHPYVIRASTSRERKIRQVGNFYFYLVQTQQWWGLEGKPVNLFTLFLPLSAPVV